jgi:hypothetical protein
VGVGIKASSVTTWSEVRQLANSWAIPAAQASRRDNGGGRGLQTLKLRRPPRHRSRRSRRARRGAWRSG